MVKMNIIESHEFRTIELAVPKRPLKSYQIHYLSGVLDDRRLQRIHKNIDYRLDRRGKLKDAISHILPRQSKYNSEPQPSANPFLSSGSRRRTGVL